MVAVRLSANILDAMMLSFLDGVTLGGGALGRDAALDCGGCGF